MPLVAKDDKEENRQAKINRFGKPWTIEQVKSAFFPKQYIGKKVRYICEKAGKYFHVGPCCHLLPHAVPMTDGKDSRMIESFEFGNYRFKFNGTEYITDNLLEQKALIGQMGVVRVGEVPEPKPVKSPEVPSWRKAKDTPPDLL